MLITEHTCLFARLLLPLIFSLKHMAALAYLVNYSAIMRATYNHFNILRLFDVLPSQVKRCAIITYKHGIYKLPHELANDLRQGS